MKQRRSSVRPLFRTGAAAVLVGAWCLVGASGATAAEETPVVPLDPPDAEVFLLPVENLTALSAAGSSGADATDVAASAGDGGAAAALALVAALAPPEVAEALGGGSLDDAGSPGAGSSGGGSSGGEALGGEAVAADSLGVESLVVESLGDGVSVASHSGNGEVDVEYGGTLVVRLPPLVDGTDAEVTLGVWAPDEEGDPRLYVNDPAAADPLQVTALGGNEYAITLPADDPTFGPEAFLIFDGLVGTHPAISTVYPLGYYLGFVGTGTGTVTLEPTTGLISGASCSVGSEQPCPGPTVHPGASFDLTVPPTSLLRSVDFGRLDTAEVALIHENEATGEVEEHYSADDRGLLTRHDASRASVNLPADVPAGAYSGAVVEGDPLSAGGLALTWFEIDVAALPVNAGLHSDTGWVEDVRQVSADATKMAVGIAMLVVAAAITVATVRPHRRPPAEG